jgi:hypothetical protein
MMTRLLRRDPRLRVQRRGVNEATLVLQMEATGDSPREATAIVLSMSRVTPR